MRRTLSAEEPLRRRWGSSNCPSHDSPAAMLTGLHGEGAGAERMSGGGEGDAMPSCTPASCEGARDGESAPASNVHRERRGAQQGDVQTGGARDASVLVVRVPRDVATWRNDGEAYSLKGAATPDTPVAREGERGRQGTQNARHDVRGRRPRRSCCVRAERSRRVIVEGTAR